MTYNHDKYPIIVGARYRNVADRVCGILENAELIAEKDDAKIEIKVENSHCYYKLNYSTFCFYWKLEK